MAAGIHILCVHRQPQGLDGIHVPRFKLCVRPVQLFVLHIHQRVQECVVDGGSRLARIDFQKLNPLVHIAAVHIDDADGLAHLVDQGQNHPVL
ncbi:hypothetical protein SDC9_181841 [bioreactor metagenome]|uniref:Uncharacterized protein n=1 Tax=bioreactor metagenome TaxID=1076179 RepID=A0A645H5R9_9ZZZZ